MRALFTVRISVGLEDFEDLKADLIQGMKAVQRVRCAPSLCFLARAFRATDVCLVVAQFEEGAKL